MKSDILPEDIPGLEALEDAICEGGTIVAECEHCKTIFVNEADAHCFDDGELERYRANALETPDRYRFTDCTLAKGLFLGVPYVWGCRCEKFLRRAAAVIDYLPIFAKWARGIADEAAADAERLKSIADTFPPP